MEARLKYSLAVATSVLLHLLLYGVATLTVVATPSMPVFKPRPATLEVQLNLAHRASLRSNIDEVMTVGEVDLGAIPLPNTVPAIDQFIEATTYYYQSAELTEKPVVAIDVEGNSMLTVLGEMDASVILTLFISEIGAVDSVRIESSPLTADKNNALTALFLKSRFRPGLKGELAVKSQLKIAIGLEATLPMESKAEY